MARQAGAGGGAAAPAGLWLGLVARSEFPLSCKLFEAAGPRSEQRSCHDNKELFDPFHLENLKRESQTTIRPSWVIKRRSRSTKALRSVIVEAANALALNCALVSVQRFTFKTGEPPRQMLCTNNRGCSWASPACSEPLGSAALSCRRLELPQGSQTPQTLRGG